MVSPLPGPTNGPEPAPRHGNSLVAKQQVAKQQPLRCLIYIEVVLPVMSPTVPFPVLVCLSVTQPINPLQEPARGTFRLKLEPFNIREKPTGQITPFLSRQKRERTEVNSWFPLRVLPGLGVSEAQADPRPNSWRVGPTGAWKSARTGVEVRRLGWRTAVNPLPHRAPRTCPRGCRRKWPIKLLCNRKRPEAPGPARGASLSEPSPLPGWPWSTGSEWQIWRTERKKRPKGFQSHDVEMLKASDPKVLLCRGARVSRAGSSAEPSSGESSAQVQRARQPAAMVLKRGQLRPYTPLPSSLGH
ncbi:PREDICTED: uncharacterized protein LOC105510272 [Colobus angolensis palliatus]|uniref:uncharacterized protein LOC105510272 n=1 Tax=Colobus angolensis palliatus TaxID=336983 RepID=UPI0005F3BBE0|nr:PREDICTED: uncharacterized protein LOC105510272 [Colobus angolensis palliatus]